MINGGIGMKSLFDQYKWLRIVLGIVIFALGLAMLIIALNNNSSGLTVVICVTIAIYCFVLALFSLIVALISEKRVGFHGLSTLLISSGVLIGLGIALCFTDVSSLIIDTVVTYCLPWILVALAAVICIKFIVLVSDADSRADKAPWIRALVIWILLLTCGIVFWIEKDKLVDIIYAIIGVGVMVIGVLVTVAGIIGINHGRKIKQIETKPVPVKEAKVKKEKKKE